MFAALWIAFQIALVLTASRRTDGAFGFRTFGESSTVKAVLYREVDGPSGALVRVKAEEGEWSAHDPGGMLRRFAWHDRVVLPDLANLDRELEARNGSRAALDAYRRALDDLAAHVPDDAETRRFLLDVTVRRNGGEPYVVHLVSPPLNHAGGT
ncbi:hypothetical protein AKJ09_02790 [Labilithrix luteola]|uniref:Uncharacterized protein n=1 Tax=Labilithrix luteola TaxID=1391654 RepID=A0A0K1PRV9_9BACT|nr:hypothetical protein [Labilithrix luteola]AKU96126.1 hypothetical protein AKJ09_02790 [Labilithrix luteola]